MLNGYEVSEPLPAGAEAVLRALSWGHRRGRRPPERWFTHLADAPRPGAIRPEVRKLPARALAGMQDPNSHGPNSHGPSMTRPEVS